MKNVRTLLEDGEPVLAIERCLMALDSLRARPHWTSAKRWYRAWIVAILANTASLEVG